LIWPHIFSFDSTFLTQVRYTVAEAVCYFLRIGLLLCI